MSIGFDRLTTLAVWPSPISSALIVLSVMAAATFATRAWFAPESLSSTRVERWKRDRVGAWWLIGGVAVIAQVAIVAWTCSGLLGIVAQHLQGPVILRSARVVSLRLTHTPATVCKCRLVVRGDADGETLPICLFTAARKSLATRALEAGDAVRVYIRKTPLGLVVVSIEPVGA